jgi:hypothetical protein
MTILSRRFSQLSYVVLSILGVLAVSAGSAFGQQVDPQKATADPDGKTVWYNCQDLRVEGKSWTDTKSFYDRLPAKAEGKATPAVWGLSHDSAGMCVCFATDAPSIRVRWTLLKGGLGMPHMPATGVSGVDLYSRNDAGRWFFVGNGRPASQTNVAQFPTAPGRPCLLYLPLYNGVKSVEIGIDKDKTLTTPEAAFQHRKPVVFYGTSITQGGCASRPGMACPAIVGRRLEVSTVNLGFSGSGLMEPEMADLLAELDASVYVLDCLWNMSPDLVTERLEPFVRKLRAARPDTPIVFAEDSNFCDKPTEKGRRTRAICEKLTAEGFKGLHFLSNQGMIGDDGEATVDGCHMTDLGMLRQADAFVPVLRPLL